MGVLGLEPGDKREPSVGHDHAIVDPAGLHIILKNDPGRAGRLSRGIYDFLGISAFPDRVISAMTKKPREAVHQTYNKIGHGQVHVIHVVGPDFTKLRVDLDKAVTLLQAAYESVIEKAEGMPSIIRVIRVPLISGGAFAGLFAEAGLVPELTAKAVLAAFRERGPVNKSYVLCTFGSTEEYERAFEYAARGHR
jgi:O-acetyl-ADP-ribose deacetylase (regulator of RNase III)